MPVLACAVCPVCLGTYAQVFSALGVGFHLGERAHTITIEQAPITSASALRTHGRASIPSDAPAAPEIAAIPMMDPVPSNEM